MVLLSVSSPATLICTCWENTDNHQFHWASTLSPVFLSFWKCRIMHVLFVVPQSVLIALLSLRQTTDIFHIDVLLNWECDLPEVSMLISSWLKQAWRSKLACLCYISHLFSHFFRAIEQTLIQASTHREVIEIFKTEYFWS